ncbi:MAG: MBL fold metallo-hydrolase [Nitrospirota bacterium]
MYNEKLEKVRAAVTILVDNCVMELLPGSRFIKRLSRPHNNFLSEHGFSALIETDGKRILVDTGPTGIALEHNLNLLGLDFDDIDIVVLSHGHSDHTGGLKKVHGTIIAHPDAFLQKFIVPKRHLKIDLTCPSIDPERQVINFYTRPLKLARGVITTGEIVRINKWEELDVFRIKRNGKYLKDSVLDDQAIIINTRKGLVIVAGCSHAGIINTLEQAIKITGVEKIYCVIGGLHFIGPGIRKVERTIKKLKRLGVKKIVPLHCTGFEGIKRLSEKMKDEFEYATAGCRIEF